MHIIPLPHPPTLSIYIIHMLACVSMRERKKREGRTMGIGFGKRPYKHVYINIRGVIYAINTSCEKKKDFSLHEERKNNSGIKDPERHVLMINDCFQLPASSLRMTRAQREGRRGGEGIHTYDFNNWNFPGSRCLFLFSFFFISLSLS